MSLPTTGVTEPTAARAAELRDQVDQVLAAFLDDKTADRTDTALRLAFTTIRDFVLRPGKRIRPIFCYWGWRGAGGTDEDSIIRSAAALELFHVFCLVHDDIIDVSATRRGLPTVHRLLADVHARSSWRGDADRFGLNTAILLGDLCMMLADELFASGVPNQGRKREAWRHYSDMRTEVTCGQYREIHEQAAGGDFNGAMRIIRDKTASYTVRRPLQIGGALAGADHDLIELYSDLGLLIGEAFQLRDDLLGVFGEPERTGKSNLDDIRDGKPTVLIALTKERSDRRQRSRIGAIYGQPHATVESVKALSDIIVETGARQAVEDMIDQRSSRALALLASAPVDQPAKEALVELVDLACHRDI